MELGADTVWTNLPSPLRAEAPGKGLRVLRPQGEQRAGTEFMGGCKAVTYLEFRVQLIGAVWRLEQCSATAAQNSPNKLTFAVYVTSEN